MVIARFIGEWGRQKCDALYRVLSEIEPLMDVPVPEGLRGKQWVCGCYREGSDTVYTASRVNINRILLDYDLRGLIEQLKQLPWEVSRLREGGTCVYAR